MSRLPIIMSCSSYYDKIDNTGEIISNTGLRDLCHRVKDRDSTAYHEAAEKLAKLVDKYKLEGYTFVPIPNHSGRAEYTLEILKLLQKLCNIRISDALIGSSHDTMYSAKKNNKSLGKDDYSFQLKAPIDINKTILFDNVIGTGNTYFYALDAIGKQIPLMVIAQSRDTSWYLNKYNNTIMNNTDNNSYNRQYRNMLEARIRILEKKLLKEGRFNADEIKEALEKADEALIFLQNASSDFSDGVGGECFEIIDNMLKELLRVGYLFKAEGWEDFDPDEYDD